MDHQYKGTQVSLHLAAGVVTWLLDSVAHALLLKEVEAKMKPYGLEWFLRDMATVTEYYMNNGDQRADDRFIVDEEEPVPSSLDAYLPQSFKVSKPSEFPMLYSPDRRIDDELSKTGKSIAAKSIVGLLRKTKAEGAAADPAGDKLTG